MGVNIYILDRRPARLRVGGREQSIGSLRRFWKITELDEERVGEVNASKAKLAGLPSPKAAMVADVEEMPLGSATGIEVKAHPVIGWDEGRTRVTDMGVTLLLTVRIATSLTSRCSKPETISVCDLMIAANLRQAGRS